MSSSVTLDCAVVGAGIAGLGAAIALRRAGHNVEIFEKSSFKNEVGAAIALTPSANKILDLWGFDFDKARPADILAQRSFRADTLQVVQRFDFRGVPERYGHRFSAYHRVDLHNGLRELAVSNDEGVPGKAPSIRLDAEVTSVDCEKGEITLADSARIQKDLIVVADGRSVRWHISPEKP